MITVGQTVKYAGHKTGTVLEIKDWENETMALVQLNNYPALAYWFDVDLLELLNKEDKPYVASNGNRFTAEQAKLITEPLRFDPRKD